MYRTNRTLYPLALLAAACARAVLASPALEKVTVTAPPRSYTVEASWYY
jgi:hypothetical protein